MTELSLTNDSPGPLALCLSATASALSLYAMKLSKLAERRYSVDLCHTKENAAHQVQCRGCIEIEELLAWTRDRRVSAPSYEGVVVSGMIHHGFTELENCASSHQCVACQVIRRAFLLAQITQEGVDGLYTPSNDTHYVFAKVHCTIKDVFLQVILGSEKHEEKSAWILCSEEPQQARTELAVAPINFDEVFTNLRPLVKDCRQNHHKCGNLKYSSSNPSWLVELIPDNKARLVRLHGSAFVHYVSLSYSWGKGKTYMEKKTYNETKALTPDSESITQHPFSRSTLPQTLQDAMRITEAFGIRYIWIDRLCIPKGANWNAEASKMHEVFGNSYFTLATTGAERAWDTLDTGRQAWSFYPRTCKINAYWLSTIDMGLNDMRLRAPLFKRGWVLQEERLSPRVLYWCGQRVYWSCASGDPYIEGSQGLCDNRASKDRSNPQRFLKYCYKGDAAGLQNEWLDIVASYVPCVLHKGEDRFTAISGLATRYLERMTTDTHQREEYLAGLWRGDIARGLSWAVPGGKASQRLDKLAPSWSWASLPLETNINFGSQFQACRAFKLLSKGQQSDETSIDAIKLGASVRQLDVAGHCRAFVSSDAIKVSWKDVCVSTGHGDRFDFQKRPEQPVYARDPESGRLLTYEARRSHVVGQLDYSCSAINTVPEAELRQVQALEIGVSSMLLLLLDRVDHDGVPCYTRVGMATNENRIDFFAGSEVKKLRLV